MKFIDVCIGIQARNPDTVILVKNGIFFYAIGKSAVAVYKFLALRPMV